MNGKEKAAVLLLTLGEEVTASVFDKLTDYQLTQVGDAMTSMHHISAEKKNGVLDEFNNKSGAVGIATDGTDFLKRALGDKRGKEVLDNVKAARPGGLAEARSLPAKVLSHFIRNEHPQTIALIVSHLEPDKASETLAFFPAELKKDILMRVATIENISPDAVSDVDDVLERELKAMGATYGEKLGGAECAAEILNMMDKTSEGVIMEKMEEEDPELADTIRELMFVFEDINGVDDRGIQTLLKEINNEQLMLALRTASEELKEKIFRNMSERAAEMLAEDMEAMGPVKLTDVEEAQQAIVNVARKLEEQGKIVIGGKGAEDVVV